MVDAPPPRPAAVAAEPPAPRRLDRYDIGEFTGLVGLVVFAGWLWLPASLLVASLALLVEVNLRSQGRAAVRAVGAPSVLARVRAARRAFAQPAPPAVTGAAAAGRGAAA